MSESDSCIPQKVAALVDALDAYRKHIGFASALDLSVHSWLIATEHDDVPTHPDREVERYEVLVATGAFVEAVDTAERMLNSVPVFVFEPLSGLIGGVPWDVRTRRTLKEIQREISFMRCHSAFTAVDMFCKFRLLGKDGFDKMLNKLLKFWDELSDRILDLQSLPYGLPVQIHSESSEPQSGAKNTSAVHIEAKAEIDRRSIEEIERNTPALDPKSIDWIAARKQNQKKLGYPTTTLATYRLSSSGGRQLSPYFGIDKDGRRWRRQLDKTSKSMIYYFAADVNKYQTKVSN